MAHSGTSVHLVWAKRPDYGTLIDDKVTSATHPRAAWCDGRGRRVEMISDKQKELWGENGYLIVENVLSAQRLDVVRDALERRYEMEGAGAGSEGSDNPGVRRLSNLFSKGRPFEALGTEPIALELARHTIGDDIRWQAMNFHDPMPGDLRSHQTIHADRSFFPNCQGYMNVIWAIDEMTERNGATRLVPGSHKQPWPLNLADGKAAIEGEIFVACPAGTAIFVHGDTWHGGRVNHSSSVRRVIHLGYSCPNTAPQYEIARAITPETRQRLGASCDLIPGTVESFGFTEDPTRGKTVNDILREVRDARKR